MRPHDHRFSLRSRSAPGGAVLAHPFGDLEIPSNPGPAWYYHSLLRVRDEGEWDTLGRYRATQLYWTGEATDRLAFGRAAVSALDGFDLIHGDQTSFEFRRIDTVGVLKQIVRLAVEPVPVTEDELTGFLAGFEHHVDTKPAYSALLVDASGNTWVEEFRHADGLEGIEVAVSGRAGDPLSLSRDAFVIDSVLIRSLPVILETDVLRATAVSPSASAASDYTAVPFIRGGASDGTPVLLDGVRLFNAFHLGGFVSAINAEVVERATVLPGSGGDALPIGSLSGAINITTRDGSRDRARMAGSLGLASSRLSVEGPVGESVSYLLSGRRTYIDGFTLALKKLGIIDGHFPYFFQDLHGKVTTDLGGVRRLSVSGYLNSESLTSFHSRRENSEEALEVGISWGNAAFSGHYRDRFGANGIIDARLGHSRFRSDLLNVHRELVSADPAVYVYDTLLAGDGSMSETRAGLRVTLAGGARHDHRRDTGGPDPHGAGP